MKYKERYLELRLTQRQSEQLINAFKKVHQLCEFIVTPSEPKKGHRYTYIIAYSCPLSELLFADKNIGDRIFYHYRDIGTAIKKNNYPGELYEGIVENLKIHKRSILIDQIV